MDNTIRHDTRLNVWRQINEHILMFVVAPKARSGIICINFNPNHTQNHTSVWKMQIFNDI